MGMDKSVSTEGYASMSGISHVTSFHEDRQDVLEYMPDNNEIHFISLVIREFKSGVRYHRITLVPQVKYISGWHLLKKLLISGINHTVTPHTQSYSTC